MKTLLNKLLTRFKKQEQLKLVESNKPIDPNTIIHESYEAYLSYKPYKPQYLISMDVRPHLGGYILKAHTGRKSIRKFFLSVSEIRFWLEENSYLKPKESCAILLAPESINSLKENK